MRGTACPAAALAALLLCAWRAAPPLSWSRPPTHFIPSAAGRERRPARRSWGLAAGKSVSEAVVTAAEAVAVAEDPYKLKWALLRLAAGLDRGQAYNPTSGDHYKHRIEAARNVINDLIAQAPPLPETLAAIDGEWELVFSTVRHGIFRSSPFFLAVQEAFGERDKSELFFRLHELQVMSWGISKVGRVAQYINSTEGRLYSEFDTSLLSLTTIPIIGFWKLLPTFGGCVVTVSDVELTGGKLSMEVQYTEAQEVPGLPPLSSFVMGQRVPVNAIWQSLPWNGGRKPTCSVTLEYVDEDMRIVRDNDGEFFVYTRPVDPRGLLQ